MGQEGTVNQSVYNDLVDQYEELKQCQSGKGPTCVPKCDYESLIEERDKNTIMYNAKLGQKDARIDQLLEHIEKLQLEFAAISSTKAKDDEINNLKLQITRAQSNLNHQINTNKELEYAMNTNRDAFNKEI